MALIDNLMTDLNRYIMVMKGIQLRIWEDRKKSPAVFDQWLYLDLIGETGAMTHLGAEIVAIRDLLLYEFAIAVDQMNHAVPVTNPDNYVVLRRGLGQYFEQHIKSTFINSVQQVYHQKRPDEQFRVLDLGCGNGQYSNALQHDSKLNFSLTLIDRSFDHSDLKFRSFTADIVKDNWEKDLRHFDLIMMNEFLHCLSRKEIKIVLEKCASLIHPRAGLFLITEQFPNERMDWRMQTYSKGGKMYSPFEYDDFFMAQGFKLISGTTNGENHFIKIFKKDITHELRQNIS